MESLSEFRLRISSKGCVQQCSRLIVDFKNDFFHYEYVIMRILLMEKKK